MSLEFTIYLWGLLDGLKGLFVATPVASGLAAIFTGISYADTRKNAYMVALRRSLVICFVSVVAVVFVPSSKTFAAIVVLPKIAHSEAVQKDIPELYNAAVEKLKSELSLTPEKR